MVFVLYFHQIELHINGDNPMPGKPIYLILLGPPMSGKGTQAARLSKLLEVPHISSGDLFRDNIKGQTDLGRAAKDFIDRGDLVPDKITIGMVAQRLMSLIAMWEPSWMAFRAPFPRRRNWTRSWAAWVPR